MSYCCVPECRSYKRKESGKRKTFHRFPVNTAIRREWVVKIRRDVGQHFKIANNTRVCSDHFPDESFTKTLCGIRKLKEGVVPSLFTWSSIKPGRRTIVRTASLFFSHVATATCGEDARGDESCHSMGQDLQEDIACTSSRDKLATLRSRLYSAAPVLGGAASRGLQVHCSPGRGNFDSSWQSVPPQTLSV
ncbi:THAP domain-containing protein 2-like isoform X3 [Clupea harengus]|uniref:THAP domain-containing protein 1 n=1 Tax=Clupea harengus TaxID=7950 RepID=A0A8M1K911_CLUHA|nr:THAP domain-containing protein 2-like isoform X3 [Clupea harengus]